MRADCLTHQGNVPLPDCFQTFGLLGADVSASTFHVGEPLPVTAHVQSQEVTNFGQYRNFLRPAYAAAVVEEFSAAINGADGKNL